MNKGDIKVLVAEDDFLIAEEISRTLKSSGYQLLGIASNGRKAVELTESLKPDVILMDIKMPKMDGLDASKIILKQYSTPIVILTAHESHDLVVKASEAGIGAYLTKPPKQDEIERAITIALARHNDILKCKKLIDELEDSRKKLDIIVASKDRFFSILAHDLRGPVASLSVFSEQLISNIQSMDLDELVEYLTVIRGTSKGLHELLENLLLWAGFQVNRIKFLKTEINPSEIVNSVIMLFQAALQHKNIKIINSIPANYNVSADFDMVNTIFRNLISNAVKFSPIGETVEVTAEIDGNSILFTVKDNGIGISEENMNKIFKIDEQVNSLGTAGEKGTGLGLLLCKEMVCKNGGEIWAESIPGNGTTFSFTLMQKD